MIRVLSVIGTRPEAIKLAPVIKELEKYPSQIVSRVCVTAQHREMLDQVTSLFAIVPDYDLNLMKAGQSPTQVASQVLLNLDSIFKNEKPDWVIVQGDTTTVMAASIAAFYARVKVGHVEAGLRTYDKWNPFPEEINRRIAGVTSDLHFAPTERARRNLLKEGITDSSIKVTGNTVIDAMHLAAKMPFESNSIAEIGENKKVVLVTAHRRENFGEPIEQICGSLKDLANRLGDTIHIVYPVHPNPHVSEPAYRILKDVSNVTLLPPLDYLPMIHLMKRSYLVLTDSGGIQEEAPSFGKPVLILRETTERPEGIDAGVARLVGTKHEQIVSAVQNLISNTDEYNKMARAANPFGEGNAAKRIVDSLIHFADDPSLGKTEM